MMMGSKLTLQQLSTNTTGIGASYRWYGKIYKSLLGIVCGLGIISNLNGQTVVTIGVGTATATNGNYNPIYRSSAGSSFDFSRAYYLFDQAELTAAGIPSGATITQIEWDKASTGATVASTAAVVFNILMKNSSASTYSTAATWGTLTTGATAVYGTTAQVIPATTGYLPFNLSTSFVYNGGALEILTDWDISAVAGSPTTGAFTWNTSLVANKVGGNSNSVALTGATSMATQGNRPNIRITFTPPPACSGMPTAGTVVASNTLFCTPQNVNLSLSGTTSASGLSFQWLSSPDGISWNPIPTATTIATTQSVTATTYYQCAVACGTNVATSNTITVNFGTTPNAGNATASSTLACVGQSVSVNLNGASTTPGLTYQWQSSPNGSTWTSITSATTAVLTQTIAGVTYYQAILGCASNTAVSSPAQVGIVGANVYATVPFLEAFDNNWQNRCDNQNVPTTSFWASNPTTGNGSWRRQDAGLTANWSFLPTGIVTPMGTGAANFHTYGATANTKGDLDLYIDMNSATSNYEMSFYNYNLTGADTIQVWLSTNAGGSFVKKGQYLTAGAWTKQIITLGAVGSSSCVVRFRGISDYGNDDMGIDSLKIYTAVCTTPPVAGVISGTNTTTVGSVNSFTVAPSTGSLQWYSSASATGPWNPIAGATSSTPTITAVGSGTVYYTVIATSLGCPADTANVPFALNVIFPGDNVCNAIPLTIGTSPLYSLFGATSQSGEVAPPGTGNATNSGWLNSNLTNSMWFTFVAPASGNVSIQAPTNMNAGANDPQLAVWSTTNCANLIGQATPTAPVGAKLVAANDDDANYTTNGGAQYSSFVRTACLTPGATYYIQLDTYTAASSGDATTIIITDLGAYDASFTGLAASYCLPAASSSLTPAVAGGVFTVNGSTTTVTSFTPTTVGTNTVTYINQLVACITTSTAIVANTPTVMAMTSNTAVCAGSSATLSAMGATNYTWTAAGTASTQVVTPSSASVYTVTGETSGCSSTSTVSVGVNAIPVVTAISSQTLLCDDGSTGAAVLTASTSASTYSWSDGATTMTTAVTPTTTTTYTVTVTELGCSADAFVTVTVSNCNGVKELVANGINVYPNPTNGILNIAISSELAGNTSIEVYDAIGKLVIKETLSTEITAINTTKLTDGIYVFKVINNNQAIKIGKIVKQ